MKGLKKGNRSREEKAAEYDAACGKGGEICSGGKAVSARYPKNARVKGNK